MKPIALLLAWTSTVFWLPGHHGWRPGLRTQGQIHKLDSTNFRRSSNLSWERPVANTEESTITTEKHEAIENIGAFESSEITSDNLEHADKTLFRKIARSIATTTKLHSVPLVPQPLVRYYAAQILEQIQLQPRTWERLNDMWAAESTPTRADDFQRDEVSELAEQVAVELQIEKCVQLPLLTAEQELAIVKFVLTLVFQQLTTTADERRRRRSRQQLETAQTLLNTERREELVERLCQKVSLPLIKDEDKKENIIRPFVNRTAGVLESILPKPVVDTLSGESPDEVAHVKEWAIQKVGQCVGVLPGVSSEQTDELAHWLVEIFLEDDIKIDDTRPVFYLLTQQEQVELLRKRQEQVAMELELCKARYKREQAFWKGKQNRLTFRVRQVEQQRAGRPFTHFRRKMKFPKSSTSILFRRRKSDKTSRRPEKEAESTF